MVKFREGGVREVRYTHSQVLKIRYERGEIDQTEGPGDRLPCGQNATTRGAPFASIARFASIPPRSFRDAGLVMG